MPPPITATSWVVELVDRTSPLSVRTAVHDTHAPKDLYVIVPTQPTTDGIPQMPVAQLQLLPDAVEHRKVAGGFVGAPRANDDLSIDNKPCKKVSAIPRLEPKLPDQAIKLMGG